MYCKGLSPFSAIQQFYQLFPKDFLKSFTSARRKDFKKSFVEDLDIDFYFADAYSSWKRGNNETSNGLLREYFPKKTDLATTSNED